MDSIPPIHGVGDDPNTFHVSLSHPVNSVTPAKPPAASNDTKVDYVKLRNDNDYYLKVIKYTLDKARLYYNNYQYDLAEQWYAQLFKYLRFYRPTYTQLYVDFAPILFDHTWLMTIQNKKTDAIKFLNEELIRLLEPSLKPTESKFKAIQEQIHVLQQHGEFPGAGNLKIQATPDTLMKLADQYLAMGARPIAAMLYQHVEVRAMLDAATARRRAEEIQGEEEHPKALPYSALPFGYSHHGVPVAPILPQPTDMAERVSPKTPKVEYHVDKVEPVYALNKDPREREKRRRRQRRPDLPPGKGKPKRPTRGKPEVTF